MSKWIAIGFCVPYGYADGDYAQLYSNGGSGDINWNTPLSSEIYQLFPSGAGIYGFGHAPFGHHRFGRAHSMLAPGFGHLPFGHHPFGYGSAMVTARYLADECGTYKFGFKLYDKLGNAGTGTPEQASTFIHIEPATPTKLKVVSYDKTTGVLMLVAA